MRIIGVSLSRSTGLRKAQIEVGGDSRSCSMSDRARSEPQASFPTTHWSLVARAGGVSSPAAREALELLCRAYWFPIYAFIRRHGADAEAARDLTQTYFTRLLEKDLLLAADPRKGRFRSFLK